MTTFMRIGAGAILFGLLSTTAGAHHRFDTEYDARKRVRLEGIVRRVDWVNPHMRIYIDVTDVLGNITTWNMELASPNSVIRQGWSVSSLLAGERVIFEGYSGKVVENRGALAVIAKASSPDVPLFVEGGPPAALQHDQR